MNDQDPIVIVGGARTAMGGMQGDFAPLTASQLGAGAIASAMQRAGISGDDVDEVIMGNVLGAGVEVFRGDLIHELALGAMQ